MGLEFRFFPAVDLYDLNVFPVGVGVLEPVDHFWLNQLGLLPFLPKAQAISTRTEIFLWAPNGKRPATPRHVGLCQFL